MSRSSSGNDDSQHELASLPCESKDPPRESDESRQEDWRSQAFFLRDMLFPFFELAPTNSKNKRSRRRNPHDISCSLVKLFGTLLCTLLLFAILSTYVLFASSSWTPNLDKHVRHGEKPLWHSKKLKPHTGASYAIVLFAKYVAQATLIHILCRKLMTSDPDKVQEQRNVKDCQRASYKPGVLGLMSSIFRFCTCRPQSERWLTEFAVDHVLLFFVALGYLGMQPCILFVKVGSSYSYMEHGPVWFQVIVCLLSIYVGLLMVGFIWIAQENFAQPKLGKEAVCKLTMVAILLLWALEFLGVAYNRERFTSFLHELRHAYSIIRVLCALGQVFVTHSLMMLGAVLLGHASHFRPAPDLTWEVARTRGLASIIILVGFGATRLLYGISHTWPLCRPYQFAIARIYKCILVMCSIVAAIVLFIEAFFHSSLRSDFSINDSRQLQQEIGKFLDYDTVLVIITYSISLFYNIAQYLMHWSENELMSSFIHVSFAAFEFSLAIFVIVAWQVRKRSLSCKTLWLALVMTCVFFIELQSVEDCEITSPVPGCCDFPHVFEHSEEMWNRCAFDHRCSKYAVSKDSPNSSRIWCKLEGRDWVVNETRLTREDAIVGKCPELHRRWNNFRAKAEASAGDDYDPLLVNENEDEEKDLSPAYRFFKALGAAGSVEFYFTVIGIVLKLICLAEEKDDEKNTRNKIGLLVGHTPTTGAHPKVDTQHH